MQDDFLFELVQRWIAEHPEEAAQLADGSRLVIDAVELVKSEIVCNGQATLTTSSRN